MRRRSVRWGWLGLAAMAIVRPALSDEWRAVGTVAGTEAQGGAAEYYIDVDSIRREGTTVLADVLIVYQAPVRGSWLSQVNAGEFDCVKFSLRETDAIGYRTRLPVTAPVETVKLDQPWEAGTRGTVGADLLEAACGKTVASGGSRHKWEFLTSSGARDEIYLDRSSIAVAGTYHLVEAMVTISQPGADGTESFRSLLAFDCAGNRYLDLGTRNYPTRFGAGSDETAIQQQPVSLTGHEAGWAVVPSSGGTAEIVRAVCPAQTP